MRNPYHILYSLEYHRKAREEKKTGIRGFPEDMASAWTHRGCYI